MNEKFKEVKKSNRKDFIKLIILIVLILGIVAVTIWLLPWIISLKDQATRDALKEYIISKGAWGILILLALQLLQVIVAFIPGEVVEVLSGLLYGTFGGYVICSLGVLIGTVAIYYTVKCLGYSFINKLMGDGKLSKYKFLNDTKRLEIVIFILFFIPGTPKDMLTYFVPFTKIKASTFFIINTVARIPSIISSTFLGASIGEGKWAQTIVIFCIIGVTGILGIIFNEKFVNYIEKKRANFKSRFKKTK